MPFLRIIPALCALASLCSLLPACRRTQTTNGWLPSDVYIWQRVWSEPVSQSVTTNAPAFGRLIVLAAEISLREKEPRIIRPQFAADRLTATGNRIGLAIRISPFAGPFRAEDASTRHLVSLAKECVARARDAGLEPCELHVDFDCADSKLGGYLVWLRAIRAAVAPIPVVPTTLPSWLARSEFAAIAKECGGFILQVHSVSAPRRQADVGRLTDPERSRAWVERAAKLGVPFRVALPTYTYLVAFDRAGVIRGISAEGPSSTWPADSKVFRWEAQPDEIADLVNGWIEQRPANLKGLIWYRLPVEGDSLNWRMVTLEAVMKGRRPRHELNVETVPGEPAEVIVTNSGEADEPLPMRVQVEWTGGKFVAADALSGYRLERQDGSRNRVDFIRNESAELIRLPPGARRNIGWVRCDTSTEMRVSIGGAAPPAAGVATSPD